MVYDRAIILLSIIVKKSYQKVIEKQLKKQAPSSNMILAVET